ncbi:MAG: NAD-binding protein [Gammaproteobacteria bacterium]|nr:NAD-binding protein [Gammaproteobacteria bacterium]
MQNIIFVILRRIRRPLIALICSYAISVAGFTLIPGADAQGNPWRMDFFHAFYFVSFMGSTIGFGEIPYPFTDAQRLWATATIYITVITWLYAIGSILSIMNDKEFRRVLAFSAFSRAVRKIREPFYLICGFGDTGTLLVRELASRDIACAVIDIDESRVHALEIEGLPINTPGLCADVNEADVLMAAGLRNRHCQGVVAVTNSDSSNLKVAITTKLLRPRLQVICRAETQDTAKNMASFGTDHIINPFDTFADRFGMLFHSPAMHLVYEWITAIHDTPLKDFVVPPRGLWVLCGYGRFGKAVRKHLSIEGVQTSTIEADPSGTRPPEGAIIGRGTEAVTLREARIESAAGVIAGTDDDTNNLSILMTAKDLNPDLFTVVRQNQRSNDALFAAARANLIMQPSTIIARRILSLIITPLLADFLKLARERDEEWANILVSRVTGALTDSAPQTWTLNIDAVKSPAVIMLLNEGTSINISQITTDPNDSSRQLPCVPLLLKRGNHLELLPEMETLIQDRDQLLFCGIDAARLAMKTTLRNFNVLSYVLTGVDRPSGYVWRWLTRKKITSAA